MLVGQQGLRKVGWRFWETRKGCLLADEGRAGEVYRTVVMPGKMGRCIVCVTKKTVGFEMSK